jgi:hypothetical protein
MIPKTPQDFRERAAECQRLAEIAVNPETRETLFYVASRWRALAEEDEGRLQPHMRKDESPTPG